MALRAVDDHPKLHELKCKLQCGRGEAIGYLEAIWHFAGRFTPAGNIGIYTDSAIESWIEWKGAPGALIAALVDAKWIDSSDTHRLLIHDWHEHADDATKLALKRKKLVFATLPDISRQVPDSVTTESGLPEPEPVPESEPELLLAEASSAMNPVASLPLVSGEEFPIAESRLRAWEMAYPGVDVLEQIQRMRVWLDANPRKRVTRRGVLRFAVTWLTNTQDRGPQRRGGYGSGSADNRNQARTDGNIDALRRAEKATTAKVVDWPGGGPAGFGERGNTADVRGFLE